MKPSWRRARRPARFLVAAALLAMVGCESIADVKDVTFEGTEGACESYCDTLSQACRGENKVYEDNDDETDDDEDETCSKVCRVFAGGTVPKGNTLACRAAQADQAFGFRSDPGESRSNCAAAGPGGGAICTLNEENPDCEGYCTLYTEACKDLTSAEKGFKTFQECTTRCAALPQSGEYSVPLGKKPNTLACRLYQATLSLTDPTNHCKSAGLLPDGECLGKGEPSCDDYCRVNRVACTGKHQVYENDAQCLAVCEATRKGDLSTDKGDQDTVGCRYYHSYFALLGAPVPHCSHSGPAGDGVCSDDGANHPNCTAFCRLLETGCSQEFANEFVSAEACVEDCEKLPDAGKNNGYSIEAAEDGDTLKCRTLHVARAVTSPNSASAPMNCAAALGAAPCL
jgi:hypothetical protein